MTGHTKLTEGERSLLALVARSKDVGEGWRRVSPLLWGLFSSWTRPELLSVEPAPEGGGGRVRLTVDGEIVVRYL